MPYPIAKAPRTAAPVAAAPSPAADPAAATPPASFATWGATLRAAAREIARPPTPRPTTRWTPPLMSSSVAYSPTVLRDADRAFLSGAAKPVALDRRRRGLDGTGAAAWGASDVASCPHRSNPPCSNPSEPRLDHQVHLLGFESPQERSELLEAVRRLTGDPQLDLGRRVRDTPARVSTAHGCAPAGAGTARPPSPGRRTAACASCTGSRPTSARL